MYAIYGNIYHQYTPNVSIYTSTMDPMGWELPQFMGFPRPKSPSQLPIASLPSRRRVPSCSIVACCFSCARVRCTTRTPWVCHKAYSNCGVVEMLGGHSCCFFPWWWDSYVLMILFIVRLLCLVYLEHDSTSGGRVCNRKASDHHARSQKKQHHTTAIRQSMLIWSPPIALYHSFSQWYPSFFPTWHQSAKFLRSSLTTKTTLASFTP